MSQGSRAYTLASGDLKKIALHAALVAASAVVAYLVTVIPSIHLDNQIAVLLVPFISSGLLALQKFLTDTNDHVDDAPATPPASDPPTANPPTRLS